ncbi:MAG: terminase [Bifidobacterium sp.]|uniref:Terminase n=1 Tax=Bifidobacterium fermentum TaxID=3059035 RepID=A0AB39UHQ1_9BIFI
MASSTRRISELAKHLILPKGIVSTGWPAVRKLAASCGIEYDDWQNGLGACLLGKRSNGLYAAGIGGVIISICRQVGKTFTIGTMIFMLSILFPGLKTLWTAHRTRTSDETFKSMQGLARRKTIAKYVRVVRQANGQQEIEFMNGSRILFGARESGFGRGFDDVDIEVFDEGQILTEKALDDMIPATNTAANPLIIMMGTPPKPSDPSEVFQSRRQEALKGADDMLYVEFGADRDADSEDRSQWRKANPSYPSRTSESSMLRMKKQLGDDSFRREGLGIWDENVSSSAIDAEAWAHGAVKDRANGGIPSFALDMSPDRSSLAIGACVKYSDGSAHIELAEFKDPAHAGTAWAAEWVASRWMKAAAVVIDGQSPAMVLLPELKSRHVRVTIASASDMGQACGRFQDMLAQGSLHHFSDDEQKPLALAVQGATIRNIGNSGAFGWNKKGSDVDISPLVACTLALHGAFTSRRHPGRKQQVMV